MIFRLFFILLFYCFLTPYAYGAPTFDAETVSTASGVSSWSFNHTIGAGCLATSNIVIVGPANVNTNLNAGITSVSVNASAATDIIGQAFTSGSEFRVELWYRVGVTTGVRDITTNYADAGNEISTSARSYCGVDQGTPIGASPQSNFLASGAGDLTPTVAVPSATGELVVDAAIASNFVAIVATAGAGQTQRTNSQPASLTYILLESDEAGAATTTMSWTTDANVYWAIVGASLKPSGAAAAVRVQTIVVE